MEMGGFATVCVLTYYGEWYETDKKKQKGRKFQYLF